MNPELGNDAQENEMIEALLLQSQLAKLLSDVGSRLVKKCVSMQVLLDDHLQPRKDRTVNDVHLFLELYNGEIFHVKAYTKHMLEVKTHAPAGKVLLTGYRQAYVDIGGREHSLRQEWYDWDADKIATEVIAQNPELFKL